MVQVDSLLIDHYVLALAAVDGIVEIVRSDNGSQDVLLEGSKRRALDRADCRCLSGYNDMIPFITIHIVGLSIQ